MKTTAYAQNHISQNKATESEEDRELFELNINLNQYPSKNDKHKIRSLVDELGERYQESIFEIAKEIVDQMLEGEALYLIDEAMDQDEDIIKNLLEGIDFYTCGWFSICDQELIRFISGGRKKTGENDLLQEDVFDEIMNVLKNKGFYKAS